MRGKRPAWEADGEAELDKRQRWGSRGAGERGGGLKQQGREEKVLRGLAMERTRASLGGNMQSEGQTRPRRGRGRVCNQEDTLKNNQREKLSPERG